MNKCFAAEKKVFTDEIIRREIQRLLKQLAGPIQPGDSTKACIRRAQQRSGLTYSQAFRAWYGNWNNIPAWIADHIRERAAAHDQKLKRAMFQSVVAMQRTNPELYADCIREVGDLLLPDRDMGSLYSGED